MEQKLTVLYLVDRNVYLTKMSRVRFHGIHKLEQHSNITLKWSGPGWDEWDETKSCHSNVSHIENKSNLKFQIVIAYKPLSKGFNEFGKLPQIKCLRYNEMYDKEWTLHEINESCANLVVCHHHNDYIKYHGMNLPNVRFEYIGHCAESTIFKDINPDFDQRPVDIVLSGAISNHYPLRQRFLKLIPTFKQLGYVIYHYNHPGYDHNNSHTDYYCKQLAAIYNKCKIALTCSGKPKSRFGKYIEIPACGTVLAGDIPNETHVEQGLMRDFVIELNVEMSDQQIINAVKQHLDSKDKWSSKSNMGKAYVKIYTQEKYAERLYQVLNSNSVSGPVPVVNLVKNNDVVQCMWYGKQLSVNEILCLKSFLMNNHQVNIYTYHPIPELEKLQKQHETLQVIDGNQIIPEHEAFTYKNGPGSGSYSAFSNLFRYKLLAQKGGWWIDMDMVCLQSFNDFVNHEYVFASETSSQVASCVIKCPANSKLMQWCYDRAYKIVKEQGDKLQWGTIGPKLLGQAVTLFGFRDSVQNQQTFCPVSYENATAITMLPSNFTKSMYGLHLWNEVWRRQNLDKNASYPKTSMIEVLRSKYIN